MARELMLTLPDELYESLIRQANETGRTVEAVVGDCLARSVEAAEPPAGSRLRRWAGAFASGVTDAGLRHDEYLGQAIDTEPRGEPDA